MTGQNRVRPLGVVVADPAARPARSSEPVSNAFDQSLFETRDWRIGIQLDGTAVFTIKYFSAPSASPSTELYAYSCSMSAVSTVPIPTTNLSDSGLYLRVYVNAYGGSTTYPGGSKTPCVVFFTSSDEGQTFVQFGDAVSMPLRGYPVEVESPGPYTNLIDHGPYVMLYGGEAEGGAATDISVGGYVGGGSNLPDMQVYRWSLQDSTGRYLALSDFETGNCLFGLNLFNGATYYSTAGAVTA